MPPSIQIHSVPAGRFRAAASLFSRRATQSCVAPILNTGMSRSLRSTRGCVVAMSASPSYAVGASAMMRVAMAAPRECPARTQRLAGSMARLASRARPATFCSAPAVGARRQGRLTIATGCPASARPRASGPYARGSTMPPGRKTSPTGLRAPTGMNRHAPSTRSTRTAASLSNVPRGTPCDWKLQIIHARKSRPPAIQTRRAMRRKDARADVRFMSRSAPPRARRTRSRTRGCRTSVASVASSRSREEAGRMAARDLHVTICPGKAWRSNIRRPVYNQSG